MTTRAGRFADDAEALGWTVERIKEGDARVVLTTRGKERYNFTWAPNEAGVLSFESGWHWVGENPEEFSNVAQALRNMAGPEAHVTAEGRRLPFDPFNDADTEILDRLRGHTIVWRNSISGMEEEGDIPVHGNHTKIRMVSRRVIDFAATEGGFRSVALDAIVRVK